MKPIKQKTTEQQIAENALRTHQRVFSNLEKATIALKALANKVKRPVYLYRTFYGRNNTAEYKLIFEEDVISFCSDCIIASAFPKSKPFNPNLINPNDEE